MRVLRAAAVSPEIVLGDVDGNVARLADAISTAAARGARLIVAPELALSGYVFADAAEAGTAALDPGDPRFDALRKVLPDGVVAVVGYAERVQGVHAPAADARPSSSGNAQPSVAGESLCNSAAVLTRTKTLAHYRKAHLWGAELLVFTPGDRAGVVVPTPVGSLGVAVCYDNEFPEVPRRLALAGAEVLALPVNWPLVSRPAGEHPPEIIQAMAAARSSRLATVIADRHGSERGIPWTGGTSIVDDEGWIIGSPDADGITIADLTLRGAEGKGLPPHNDLFADRRPHLY